MSIVSKYIGIWKTSSKMMMKKNETYKELKIKDYVFEFYYKPFYNHSEKIDFLYSNLAIINQSLNYKFGIFKDKNAFVEFSKNCLISIVFLKGKPIGSFSNLIDKDLHGENISLLGGLVCLENKGIDIVNMLPPIHALFTYEKIGDFYGIAITRHPSVLESMSEHSDKTFPCPDRARVFNKKYLNIAEYALKNHSTFFIEPQETFSFNNKKFVLTINNSSNIIKQNIFEHSLAKKNRFNLFMNFWINYEMNDFLFIVAKYNKNICKRTKKIVSYIIYNSNLK